VIGTGYALLGAEGSVVLDDLIPSQTSVLVGAGEVVGPGEPADGTTAGWQIEATALCVPISGMALQIVSATSPFKVTPAPGDNQFARAFCPSGTKPLGMGQALSNGFGQVAPGGLAISDSDVGEDGAISYDSVVAVAGADLDGYSGAWSVTAYAICGPDLPGLSRRSPAPVNEGSISPKTSTIGCPGGRAVLSAGFGFGFGYVLTMREVVITKAEVGTGLVSNGVTQSATERTPGTNLTWEAPAEATCADGTNTPIVTPFNLNGRWEVGFGVARPVTITEAGGILSADMSTFSRPTARGGVTDNSHITVSFPDDRTYTGTLVAPGRIVWSNGTTWTKI